MNILFPALAKEVTLTKINECFNQNYGQNYIYGLAGTQKHIVIANAYKQNPKTTIIITHNQDGEKNGTMIFLHYCQKHIFGNCQH